MVYQRRNAGGGNVTVDEESLLIRPAQAWANNIQQFLGTVNPDVSSQGITYLSPEMVANCAWLSNAAGVTTFTLGGTNSIPAANIDEILSALLIAASGNALVFKNLYLYGPNMGSPTPTTPAVPHEDGYITISLAGVDVEAINDFGEKPQKWTLTIDADTLNAPTVALILHPDIFGVAGFTILIDNENPLSGSTLDSTNGAVWIGLQDTPTSSDIAAKIVELTGTNWELWDEGYLPGIHNAVSCTVAGAVITFTGQNKVSGWSFNNAAGATTEEIQPYQASTKTGGGYLPMDSVTLLALHIEFDPSITLSGSAFSGDTVTIGTSDEPTAAQMADTLRSLSPVSAEMVGTTSVKFTFQSESEYPLADYSAETAAITQSDKFAGDAFVPEVINTNLATLIASYGWHGDYTGSDGSQVVF